MLMILGVALWLFFPRPEKGDTRWLRWAVVLAGLAQIAGVGLFFHTMWSRIRPLGKLAREAKGERF